jgi:ribosomal protein S18 acetylase RimI-like enzyme
VEIRELDGNHRGDAIALWDTTGLIRPWNPPDADFDRAVSGEGSAVLGAFDGDRLVATVMVGHDGHRGWVYYLAVDPTVQATGVGRSMMRAAEAWVRSAGIPKIQLMVRTTNTAALGFYDAVGFSAEDTVVLSRWLDKS